MSDTKSRILYILKYLWQNTDAEHYVTTGDIITYLIMPHKVVPF